MTFNIHCNYCDSETIIKNNTIRMTCMCDDDHRIINLEDFINNRTESDYLYKMFNDNFQFSECK